MSAKLERNRGIALDLDVIEALKVNRSALERRAASLGGRRSVKKQWQAAWLLKAITLIDLTTLSGDDTVARVRRLCAKARQPVRVDVLEKLGAEKLPVRPGAVCVYHHFVETAVEALKGSGIPVAAVSTGFPAGLSPLATRLAEIEASVKVGAAEIDIVIERHLVLTGDWQGLHKLVRQARKACGTAHLKVILGTGDLGTLSNVAKASMVSMMAGADFIKTSTGKESVNATLPVALVMVRMIRQYEQMTEFKIGFKPAGGISDAKTALLFLILMKEELGVRWLQPDLFRIGASSLLTDIERQLEHCATGRYAARAHQPLV
jgi:deoxyribose-phosphate aldolase